MKLTERIEQLTDDIKNSLQNDNIENAIFYTKILLRELQTIADNE